MKKEIIINPETIKDENITEKVVKNKYLLVKNNKIFLKKHHNTYFLLDENNCNSNDNLLIVKKEYVSDYPFIGENTLYITNYYVVSDCLVNDGEWISLDEVLDVLENSKYDNPRNQEVTNEIIKIIEILLNNK